MTSVLSANPSARISTDLAGPDLWSVADGPVISRATIHVALQPVHNDSGTRSHTRAAALVRGVLTIPVGSARSSSARKCSPRRHPLPHRYALGSLLLGALVFGFMLSSIGGLVKGLDKENIRLQQKMDEVKEFTRWHKMPSDLSSRVRKYDEDH